MKSTVWTYFNLYNDGAVFMGEQPATMNIVTVHIYVIEGGLDTAGKKKLIPGVTAIFGRQLGITERPPVYIVIHEIAEVNWAIFGNQADLAALRATPLDVPAI
ncbi:Tautomerase enzyme [compost metagenome]